MSLHLDMFAEISLRKIVTNIKGLELYEDIEPMRPSGEQGRRSLENWRYISFDSSYVWAFCWNESLWWFQSLYQQHT